MHIFSFFALLFIFLPIIEITVFSVIVGILGLPATMLTLLFTSLLGIFMIHWVGWQPLRQLLRALVSGRSPTQKIFRNLFLLLAGLALLAPGFATDFVGLLLLIPTMQKIATRLLVKLFPQLGNISDPQKATSPDDGAGEINASRLVINVTAHEVKDSEPENTQP